MNAKTNTHAKDYLLDYKAKSNTPLWLASLIQKVIDSNGKLDDSDKNEIFTKLLQEDKLDTTDQEEKNSQSQEQYPPETKKSNPTTSVIQQQLILKKITHKKGVNALISNQSIVF